MLWNIKGNVRKNIEIYFRKYIYKIYACETI